MGSSGYGNNGYGNSGKQWVWEEWVAVGMGVVGSNGLWEGINIAELRVCTYFLFRPSCWGGRRADYSERVVAG